jgi:glycosyltransferase involved in cell wall biosynthesis
MEAAPDALATPATQGLDCLERILAPQQCDTQPPLHEACTQQPPLGVVVGSLALGGAERIVLDWAQLNRSRYRIHLCVLQDLPIEWPLPQGVHVVRASGAAPEDVLTGFAGQLRLAFETAGRGKPRVLCHMTRREHRDVLERAGVSTVAVLHNAKEGWQEPAQALQADRRVVAVSRACVQELAAHGRLDDVSIIRHLPRARAPGAPERSQLRQRLCHTLDLPAAPQVRLVAMVGGIKPQKNCRRAIEVFARLAADSLLVIFGGPIGQEGLRCWHELREAVQAHGLQERVRLPGFVPDAARYLGAFDVLLNTSHYEGLSIATLEALAARVPVVASRVGGQGEVAAQGLTLVEADASPGQWVAAVNQAWASRPMLPSWAGFPAHRLWTLEHLVADGALRDHVLFVTANLNAGGAQRSLVNLAKPLSQQLSLEVAVTGVSSSDWFCRQLQHAGVKVSRTGDSRDCFDHAEALLGVLARSRAKVMCLWNLDPKIKLLLAKVLPAQVRLVDVSPGGYAFAEMAATDPFQQLVGFTQGQFYARLDWLVLKYSADVSAHASCRVGVVRNGVPLPAPAPQGAVPRIIINGRIAPTKFLHEVVQAMSEVWQQHPRVELHILGVAEQRHEAYAHQLLAALQVAVEVAQCVHGHKPQVVLHGAVYELGRVARADDIAVVLGHHQGCPNAVLEAMAHQLAVVANDSGGTAEAVRHHATGLLLAERTPQALVDALHVLIANSSLRSRLARSGHELVRREFSMAAMTQGYRAVFESLFHEGA